MRRFLHAALAVITFAIPSHAASNRIQLQLDTSEADAVLAIIARQSAGQPHITSQDWQKLFATEPYVRLKKREASLHRDFTDDEFQQFVLSQEMVKRAPELRRTLDEWKKADMTAIGQRVLRYLPSSSVIHAKVFPVIKPQTNSFVFENLTDPAIFLYLDPAQSREAFEIVAAHELHHIGLSSNSDVYQRAIAPLPPGPRHAAEWMGAFGEGLAMLAAAGGPDVNPVATYKPELQQEWKRDTENFNSDLARVQKFFLDTAEGRITGENEINARGFTFFGSIGPWYSVGYKMVVVVERRYGRAALIGCMLDFRRLLATYNRAAAEHNAHGGPQWPLWSPKLLSLVKAEPVR